MQWIRSIHGIAVFACRLCQLECARGASQPLSVYSSALHTKTAQNLVNTGNVTTNTRHRTAERVRVALPARLTWKDASGAVRFASVTTRDVSAAGVFVETDTAAAIPLYRLVHLQLERDVRDTTGLPQRLREGRVLSAVWRVGACRRSTGTPEGYALRFLVEPSEKHAAQSTERLVATPMAAAS